jgi:hypothetical protein
VLKWVDKNARSIDVMMQTISLTISKTTLAELAEVILEMAK